MATKKFSGNFRLFSSKHSETCKALTFAALHASLTGGVDSVDVASAYYDTRFFKRLFDSKKVAGKADQIRLLFNGLGGSRLTEQRDELRTLARDLKKTFDKVQIRLAFEKGIFHPKLLLFRRGKKRVAYLGSANTTEAAMVLNEEIMLEVSGKTEPLVNYFESVWYSGISIDDLDEKILAKTLIAFFRTGKLYFKPTAPLQITLNPFNELIAALPQKERAILGGEPLPHSDASAGMGPFNVRRALGMKETYGEDGRVEKRVRFSIRPYAVETCFGYWVPSALDADLQGKLSRVSSKKRANVRKLKAAIETAGDAGLTKRYVEYLDAARNRFDRAKIPWRRYLPAPARNPFARSTFEVFLKRLRGYLENETFVRRMCDPFVPGPMPEIWDDHFAFDEFKNTFFEYLSYISQRRIQPSVPGEILRRAQCMPDASRSDILKGLAHYLKNEGWGPDDWPGAELSEGDENAD